MPMTPQQIQDLTDAFNTALGDPTKAKILERGRREGRAPARPFCRFALESWD